MTSLMDSGAGTLRDAIAQVNASTDPANTIAIAVPGVISLDTALPTLQKFVDIVAMGSGVTTIQRTVGAATNFRIFLIDATSVATMTGLTVAKGTLGGIHINGRLTMNQCKVVDCDNPGDGGGTSVAGNAHLTLRNTVVNGNSADGNGAGVYMTGSTIDADVMDPRLVTENNTQITNNTTQSRGGGIYVDAPGVGDDDVIRIRNSSINQNTAKLEGGGLYLATVHPSFPNEVDVTITDSNVLENRSLERNGGAIHTGAKLLISGTSINGNKGRCSPGTPSRSIRRRSPSRSN